MFFVWRSFNLGDWRLAMTSLQRRPVAIRPACELARVFHALPPEPPYSRRAPRIERAERTVLARYYAMAATSRQLPPSGVALLDDACSVAGGVLIAASGEIVKESLANTGLEQRFGPFRRGNDGSLTARIWPMTRMAQQAGDFIFLRQTGDTSYGNWLIEMLPRLAIAAQFCDLSKFAVVVSWQSRAMEQIVRDSLGLFGISPEQILPVGESPVFFQRLVFPLPVAGHLLPKSQRAVEVLESLPTRLPAPATAPKRIYVTSEPGGRRLANEADILNLLKPLGFTLLDPAQMSFTEQVQAFSQAEMIAGVCGDGLTNAAFAPRGVRVFVLTPPGKDEARLWGLTDLKQGPFFSLHGEDAGLHFSIDLAAFKSLLAEFAA
ncbi:MAG TPA: glycosyltransferase family 61 protein [Rhodoblastus sp.]|nr:glycosyltransferase family 61 protein [Rhodoblastus sp.]